jgi:hypothetical protein
VRRDFGIMKLAAFRHRHSGFGFRLRSRDAAPGSPKRFRLSKVYFNRMICIVFFSIAAQ